MEGIKLKECFLKRKKKTGLKRIFSWDYVEKEMLTMFFWYVTFAFYYSANNYLSPLDHYPFVFFFFFVLFCFLKSAHTEKMHHIFRCEIKRSTYTWLLTYIWNNGYRCSKWSRWPEFYTWTWLFAYHIVLTSLGKLWIQQFSLWLYMNS